MKKILIISIFIIAAFANCKKKENTISQVVTVSYPTVTLTGGQFYSIPVGGNLPQISATAYDSFYHENETVSIDQGGLDNNTPGLYIVNAVAKNKYGFKGSASVYIAVTDIDSSINLAGAYVRTSNSVPVTIDRLARGLYVISDAGGIGTDMPAYFVQVDDTSLVVPQQNDPTYGAFYCSDAKVNMAPGDTTISWVVQSPYFLDNVRTFQKQ